MQVKRPNKNEDSLHSDTEELEENINLEAETNSVKMYKNRCNECDFEVEANRKYEIVKIMLRHNENCFSNIKHKKEAAIIRSCEICEFAGSSDYNMKRHKRDAHGCLTESTSPPLKRKRMKSLKTKMGHKVGDMEVEEHTETH